MKQVFLHTVVGIVVENKPLFNWDPEGLTSTRGQEADLLIAALEGVLKNSREAYIYHFSSRGCVFVHLRF